MARAKAKDAPPAGRVAERDMRARVHCDECGSGWQAATVPIAEATVAVHRDGTGSPFNRGTGHTATITPTR